MACELATSCAHLVNQAARLSEIQVVRDVEELEP